MPHQFENASRIHLILIPCQSFQNLSDIPSKCLFIVSLSIPIHFSQSPISNSDRPTNVYYSYHFIFPFFFPKYQNCCHYVHSFTRTNCAPMLAACIGSYKRHHSDHLTMCLGNILSKFVSCIMWGFFIENILDATSFSSIFFSIYLSNDAIYPDFADDIQ